MAPTREHHLTDEQIRRIAEGGSVRAVARELGCPVSTVQRYLRTRAGIERLAAAREAPSAPTSALVAPSAPVSAPSPEPREAPAGRHRAYGAIRDIAGEEVCFGFPLTRAPEVLGYRTLDGIGEGGQFNGARAMLRYMKAAGELVIEPGAADHVLTYPVNTREGRQRLVLVRGCYERLQVKRLAKVLRYDAKGGTSSDSALYPAAVQTGTFNPLA